MLSAPVCLVLFLESRSMYLLAEGSGAGGSRFESLLISLTFSSCSSSVCLSAK